MQRAIRVLKHILQQPALALRASGAHGASFDALAAGDLEGDLLHRRDAPEAAGESHAQVLDRDGRRRGHDIHAESRATTLSSALGRSSSGAAATSARV